MYINMSVCMFCGNPLFLSSLTFNPFFDCSQFYTITLGKYYGIKQVCSISNLHPNYPDFLLLSFYPLLSLSRLSDFVNYIIRLLYQLTLTRFQTKGSFVRKPRCFRITLPLSEVFKHIQRLSYCHKLFEFIPRQTV